jgi:DNA topoisomerase-2
MVVTKSSSDKKPTNKSKSDDIEETSVEDTYKMMKLHDQILALPDTYIGSIEPDKIVIWINNEDRKMVKKEITYVPGLYKIYDEIIVNAHDHLMRPNTGCKNIKVNFNQKTGEISVWNDGDGIPIQIHKEHNMYIPEMIFGNLLTSSNYGKKGKIWGGKNGIGAKAANIFSTSFDVETVDSKMKKKYFQHFYDNMYHKDTAKITNSSEKSYTKITFTPDYKRFGVDGLTDDIIGLFRKRVYDLAAIDFKRAKVYLILNCSIRKLVKMIKKL